MPEKRLVKATVPTGEMQKSKPVHPRRALTAHHTSRRIFAKCSRIGSLPGSGSLIARATREGKTVTKNNAIAAAVVETLFANVSTSPPPRAAAPRFPAFTQPAALPLQSGSTVVETSAPLQDE